MNTETPILTIQLLDKTWQIRCPSEKAGELKKSAHYLDGKMREVADQNRLIGSERILVMAALSAVYELIAQHAQKDLYIDSLSSRIQELQDKNNGV
jgi:cell division protein ZapA